MNTFWLKVAAVIILIVAVIIVISKFSGSERGQQEKPAPQEKTVGDVWHEDDKRLRAEPNITAQAAAEQQIVSEQQKPVQFRQLTEEEEVGASQLFEMAMTQRKMGRLPGIGYGQMVGYCRQIIEKYPDSEYAYKAKRILSDIPERERVRYHITDEEIDLGQ